MDDVTRLLEQLDADDDIQRRIAVFDLAEMGQPIVQPLMIALTDTRPRIRLGAALALGKLGNTSAAAVPALITTLADPVDPVRRCACDALAQIGEAAEPELIHALDSADANTQSLAAVALGRIGKPSTTTISKVLGLLTHEHAFVRRQAAHALAKFGSDSVFQLTELLRGAVRAKDWSLAEEAVVALRETDAKTEEVYSAIFDAYLRGAGRVRDEALAALRVIDPNLDIRQNKNSVTFQNLPGRVAADSLRQRLQPPPDS